MTSRQYIDEYRHISARRRMVEHVTNSCGIQNQKLIDTMLKVPRHFFVDDALREMAYKDEPLPIGSGQTISHPSTVAVMTQLLAPEPHQRILEIGTGSGYQTAVLAEMAGKVYSVEWFEPLAAKARKLLGELRYYTVRIEVGDGSQGWPDAAPFHGIIVTAGSPEVIPALCRQLTDGGRLVIPVGTQNRQVMTRVERRGDQFEIETLGDYQFVELRGMNGWRNGREAG